MSKPQLQTTDPQPPLIVITGPTASGKTGLALKLAQRYQGEIICADSRTIYKGMDIGTAKPTLAEQAMVPHHLLDVVEPGESFTVADFQVAANAAIADIRHRGKVPFLVGGTGLYIDAVILEYEWPEKRDESDYEPYTVSELQQLLRDRTLPLPTNISNKRHLVSALQRGGEAGRARTSPRDNVHVVAISTEMSLLERRIQTRALQMFEGGIVEETKRLGERYGWESEAMTGNIYPLIKQHLDGRLTQDEVVERFVIKDRQLAKRQLTWLKRHEFVQWCSLEEARGYIETILG